MSNIINSGTMASQDLMSKLLYPNNVIKGVVQYKPQLKKITTLSQMVGNVEYTNQYKVINYKRGNTTRVVTVKSVTLSGAGSIYATIVYTDPNIQPFREKDQLRDDRTGTIGKVIDNGTVGQCTVQFDTAQTSTVTAFTSSDFAAGHFAAAIGVGSNPLNPLGTASVNYDQTPLENWIEIIADSQGYQLHDFVAQTYLDENFNSVTKERGKWFIMDAEMNFLDRVANQYENKILLSNQKAAASIEGGDARSMGWFQQIRERGGMWEDFTTMPVENDWRAFIEHTVDECGATDTAPELLMIGGSRALGNFASTMAKYITYPGTANTFGGTAVKGLNVTEYTWIGGIKLRTMSYDQFNNTNLFSTTSAIPDMNGKSRMQGTVLLLNTGNVTTTTGATKPFATNYKYNAPTPEFYKWVPGLLNKDGSVATNPTNTQLNGASQYFGSLCCLLNNERVHGVYNINA